MHLSGMRPAPEFARGQLAAGIGAEGAGEGRGLRFFACTEPKKGAVIAAWLHADCTCVPAKVVSPGMISFTQRC
jgi:hypothetical protein